MNSIPQIEVTMPANNLPQWCMHSYRPEIPQPSLFTIFIPTWGSNEGGGGKELSFSNNWNNHDFSGAHICTAIWAYMWRAAWRIKIMRHILIAFVSTCGRQNYAYPNRSFMADNAITQGSIGIVGSLSMDVCDWNRVAHYKLTWSMISQMTAAAPLATMKVDKWGIALPKEKAPNNTPKNTYKEWTQIKYNNSELSKKENILFNS